MVIMPKKKAKGDKTTKRRENSWTPEDVKVHTSLPPQVDGQLRCFCKLSVEEIIWSTNIPKPPDLTLVRTKWWGEGGEGSVFKPVDVLQQGRNHFCTTARYPIRSGLRQFASYLNDMGCLTLEVLTSPMEVPVGTAEVTEIALLSNMKPIDGLFTVFSPTDDKLADLKVSIVLEQLMESYDSMGSVPTTDISMETYATQESALPHSVLPEPHSHVQPKPDDDLFVSPASHLNDESRRDENGFSLRYADDLRQTLNYDLPDIKGKSLPPISSGSTVSITANGDVVTSSNAFSPPTKQVVRSVDSGFNSVRDTVSNGSSDVLSVLLNRGNKLRDAMIVSTLPNSQSNSKQDVHNNSLRHSTGNLYQDYLTYKDSQPSTSAAVDLVVKSPVRSRDFQMLQMVNNGRSPGSSLSSDQEILSDPCDPLQEDEIINDLFYKYSESDGSVLSDFSPDEGVRATRSRSRSNSVSSLKDSGNARPPSRRSSSSTVSTVPVSEAGKKKKSRKARSTSKSRTQIKPKRKGSKKRVSKSRSRGSSVSDFSDSDIISTPRSEISRVSFDMMDSDIDDMSQETTSSKKTVDGLSVERLTLLGRVHVARVTIDSIDLNDLNSSITSRKSSKSLKSGKPPRPIPKTKKHNTYFIEYQFPVVAISRDKYSPNAMATEVMRVASRNIKTGVVSFNHRSVFPIMFDGTSVDKWWKSALIFKIFAREPGQKTPTAIGSCGFPLKSILRSDGLYLNRSLEIRETGRSQINGSSRGIGSVLGYLKAAVELASDHKDFATALARTKIAEMSGKTKIVPLPQPVPPPPPVITDNIISDLENHLKRCDTEVTQATVQPPLPERPLSSTVNQLPQSIQQNIQSSNQTAQNIPPSTNLDRHSNIPNQSELRNPPNQMVYQLPLTKPNIPVDEVEALSLNMMLHIPEGRNISVPGIPPLHLVNKRPVLIHQQQQQQYSGNRDMNTRNTYLVCRMFWCNDAVSSSVCWGTTEPVYNFLQVVPVLMTPSLLERMRNNFMIIEVWDKKTTAENDKLVGIIKLSLHQFFMSFRERKISNALMKSQFPVVAVDNFLPVLDPFSGYQFGQIHILLVMGTSEQVALLQRQRINGEDLSPERPHHHLERQDLFSKDSINKSDLHSNSVEHCFEISIESIKGLKLFENMIWGEADCFIQYHFPTQLEIDGVKHATPTLRSYRTGTTLCIPDPVFNDGNRHRITLNQGVPVQRELLTACANSGGGSGGLPFEVWCRYYHPNVRDQVIAKATLPLAKLCAMVTMQKRGEPSVQTFSLPLSQVAMGTDADNDAKAKCIESGMLDITLHYKIQIIKNDVNINIPSRTVNTSNVCISIGVIKATGLKTAADHVARLDHSMQYPAEVGVNTYVRIKLSFLQQGERLTKTIARTFAPEFSHYLDFPCPLLFTQPLADAQSLAEILESAEAVFEVWHQVPGSSFGPNPTDQSDEIAGKMMMGTRTTDTLLGTTTISLYSLLIKKTGLAAWFPIIRPTIGWNKSPDQEEDNFLQSESSEFTGLQRVVGGLELSLRFAQAEDRERVISTGRSVGWSPMDSNLEQVDWNTDGEVDQVFEKVKISVDYICFPLQNAIFTGQSQLDRNARCYIRYKFYDKGAVISKNASMTTNDAGYLATRLNHQHQYVFPKCSTYQWYLQEESLEVQVWITYSRKNNGEKRPKQRDRLIGSAFVELEELCKANRSQHRLSGIYPLIKPGSNGMGGSCIRIQIRVKPHSTQNPDSEEEDFQFQLTDSEQDYDSQDSFHQLTSRTDLSPKKQEKTSLNEENSFGVHISIERAMHLPTIANKDRSGEIEPSSYVSYQTCEGCKPICTDIFPKSTNPIWDHVNETRISNNFFSKDNKNLVFKVWHKPIAATKSPDKSSDRVLGFVSVDLSPLSSGLLQICGWYNILDFSGQCQGQIKVNITPQAPVSLQRTSDVSFISHQIHSTSVPSVPLFTPWTSTYSSAIPTTSSITSQRHLQGIQQHHQQLSDQLRHRTATTIDQSMISQASITPTQHWNPDFSLKFDESSSKSFLFSSLRKQLDDLDVITENFKHRLNNEPPQVSNLQKTIPDSRVTFNDPPQGLTFKSGSSSGDSRGQNTDRNAVINSNRDSSQSAIDSGTFSVDNLNPVGDNRRFQESLYPHFSTNSETLQTLVTSNSSMPHNTSINSNKEFVSCALIRNNFQTLLNSHPVFDHNEMTDVQTPEVYCDAENSTGFIPKTFIPSESEPVPGDPPVETVSMENRLEEEHRPVNTWITPDAINDHKYDCNSDDGASEDEKFGNYHSYREMLDAEDGVDHEYEGEDDEEVITPRAINDFSGFYAKNRESSTTISHGPRAWQYVHQQANDNTAQSVNSTERLNQSNTVIEIRETDMNESAHSLQGNSCSSDGTPRKTVPQIPYTVGYTNDSWMSEDSNSVTVYAKHQISENNVLGTNDSRQDLEHQTYLSNHLLAKVELIDTLTSTTEGPVNLAYLNNNQSHIPRNMLSRVELESVDSGTTHLPDSSSSKASRQSSAQSRDSRKTDISGEQITNHRQTQSSSSIIARSQADERPQSESTPRSHVETRPHDQSHDEGVATSRTDDLETYFTQGQNRQLIYSMSCDDSDSFQFRESLKLSGQLSPLNSHRQDVPPISRNVEGFVQTEVHSDRTTDSGLDSATKSSQDEKETFFMLDSTVAEKTNLPNFFLDFGEQQASMRALQMATAAAGKITDTDIRQKITPRTADKVQAASELAARLTSKTTANTLKTKGRQLPTAEETKRIAKIFSAKLN